MKPKSMFLRSKGVALFFILLLSGILNAQTVQLGVDYESFLFSKEDDRKQYIPDQSITGEEPIYEELFNLKDDPKEMGNLADNPEYEKIMNTYRDRSQVLVTQLAK